jgi:hypothetical protein
MKKSVVIALAFVFVCGSLMIGCKSKPKGDPELLAAVEDIAKTGCKCKDRKCLFDVKVKDKSIIQWRMVKTDNLTDDEKKKYYDAWKIYTDCEIAIIKPAADVKKDVKKETKKK